MITERTLTLEEAEKVLQVFFEALAKKATSPPIAVAIVGSSGTLICLKTMDGTKKVSPLLALAKAYTAVKVEIDTATLFAKGRNAQDFTDPWITCLPGGVPIFFGDEVIGGVGVSGATPEQDNELANLCLEGLSLELS